MCLPVVGSIINMAAAPDVKGFLDQYKLSQYFPQFLEHGYDDIEDVITMTEARLQILMNLTGISKKDGHRGRFLAAILQVICGIKYYSPR